MLAPTDPCWVASDLTGGPWLPTTANTGAPAAHHGQAPPPTTGHTHDGGNVRASPRPELKLTGSVALVSTATGSTITHHESAPPSIVKAEPWPRETSPPQHNDAPLFQQFSGGGGQVGARWLKPWPGGGGRPLREKLFFFSAGGDAVAEDADVAWPPARRLRAGPAARPPDEAVVLPPRGTSAAARARRLLGTLPRLARRTPFQGHRGHGQRRELQGADRHPLVDAVEQGGEVDGRPLPDDLAPQHHPAGAVGGSPAPGRAPSRRARHGRRASGSRRCARARARS